MNISLNFSVSILEKLQKHAEFYGDSKPCFSFVNELSDIEASVTYKQLNEKSYVLGQYLINKVGLKRGDRVILAYEPCLDFMFAFFACVQFGIIAVPACPPDPNKGGKEMNNFISIINSSGSRVALSSTVYRKYVKVAEMSKFVVGKRVEFPSFLKWITTDDLNLKIDPNLFQNVPKPIVNDLNDVAFLQYTSGSTSEPKGVMVTHQNLAHNLSLTYDMFLKDDQVTLFSWAPQYHDMGLIGGYLTPLYYGHQGYYMSPYDFVKNPVLWVHCMTKFKATFTVAPNFAYALTARKFLEAVEKSNKNNNLKNNNTATKYSNLTKNSSSKSNQTIDLNLNLSTLKMLSNGSEPIHIAAIEFFYSTFEKYGLQRHTMCPSWGLAEHTLGGSAGIDYNVLLIDKEEMETNKNVLVRQYGGNEKTLELISCYIPSERYLVDVKIVDADSFEALVEGKVGEIWINSPSKAIGYWSLEEKTIETFRAKLSNINNNVEYLRTGDLGFLYEKHLYICGRLKDLIIIRGRNIYPQDIEKTCELTHTENDDENINDKNATRLQIRKGCSAAFSISVNGNECIVYVAETVEKNNDEKLLNELISNIRKNVVKNHSVSLSVVCLIEPRSVPKTTSGKIARQWAKKFYLSNNLKYLKIWSELDSLSTNFDDINNNDEDPDFIHHDDFNEDENDEANNSVSHTIKKVVKHEKKSVNEEAYDLNVVSYDFVVEELKKIIRASINIIVTDKEISLPLVNIGLDSVKIAEIKSKIEHTFSAIIPDVLIFDADVSLTSLATCLKNDGKVKHRPVLFASYQAFSAFKEFNKVTAKWFKDNQTKANIDSFKFIDDIASNKKENVADLTLFEEMIYIFFSFFMHGFFIWFPIVLFFVFYCLPLNIAYGAIVLLLTSTNVVYLTMTKTSPLYIKTKNSFFVNIALKYHSHKIVVESKFERYNLTVSFFALSPNSHFNIDANLLALTSGYTIKNEFHVLINKWFFYIPLLNIVLKYCGYEKNESKNITKIIHEKKHSVGMYVGGNDEKKINKKSKNDEILCTKDVQKMIKIALENNTQIIPCYTFGASKLFTNYEFLSFFAKIFNLSLFYGRFFLPIAYRVPLLTIVGKPINVQKNIENNEKNVVTVEMVYEYQEKYLKEVRRIFENYKNMYGWEHKNLVFKRS